MDRLGCGDGGGGTRGHVDEVMDAVFSSTGDKIATASNDGIVRIFDALTFQWGGWNGEGEPGESAGEGGGGGRAAALAVPGIRLRW